MALTSIKKNLVYYFILSVSQVLFPLITIPYISRVLDPEGVGKVSFIDSFTYYFIAIAELGITVYGTREVARLRDDRTALRKLVSELILLQIYATLMTVFIYGIMVYAFYDRINDIRLLSLSLVFLFLNALACEWYFLGTEQFRYISLRSILIRGLAVVLIFALIRSAEDFYLYYAIIVVSGTLITMLNFALVWKQSGLAFKGANWKKHISFTWINYIISLVYSISLYLDNVLLGLLSTAYAVGIYAFAMKIVRLSGSLLSDSLLVFFPRIVSLIQDRNRAELQHTLLRSVRLIIVFAVPLFIGTFMLSEPLVLGLLGPKFQDSVFDLRILSLFPMLRALNLFMSKQILIPYNKEKFSLWALSAGSGCLVLLILSLAPEYSDRGVCFSVIIAELATLAMNYYYVIKTDRELVIFDHKTFLQSLLSSLPFIPVVYFIQNYVTNVWMVLSASIICCFLVYVLMQLYVCRNSLMLSVSRSGMKYFFNRAE